MDWAKLLKEALETLEYEEIRCDKGVVCLLPCGKRTYTWFVQEGVFFTALRVEGEQGELANTVWRPGNIIHSLDDDITLPAHAMTEGILRKVYSEQFNAMIEADPKLGFALAEYYHAQFTMTLTHYRQAALEPSEKRLLRLEQSFKNIEGLENERIDDTTLSLFMGMHRVSVSRLRRKLNNEKDECSDE